VSGLRRLRAAERVYEDRMDAVALLVRELGGVDDLRAALLRASVRVLVVEAMRGAFVLGAQAGGIRAADALELFEDARARLERAG